LCDYPPTPCVPPETPCVPPETPCVPPETPCVPPETPCVPPETPCVPPETPCVPPETPCVPPETPCSIRCQCFLVPAACSWTYSPLKSSFSSHLGLQRLPHHSHHPHIMTLGGPKPLATTATKVW
uniref:Uncharacterized protein n=1 Tax=Xiphophorus maculatus TaxID=8083 RepID=A0A3B5QPE7_XIPMA